MTISRIQQAVQAAGVDGWLFYDFRGSDPLAASILNLPRGVHRTRRWFYFVPASGEPVRVVHAIEPAALDHLPGDKRVYLAWQQLHSELRDLLAGKQRIAMQYSPLNNIPYVARVDAGTVELIRSLGVEVVSSADLVSEFEATLTSEQHRSHIEAADQLGALVHAAFGEIARRLRQDDPPTEYEIQQFLCNGFEQHGLMADHAPIVAVDAHSADPHFEPSPSGSSLITPDCFVLIDAWCKQKTPGAIYADITWTGWTGKSVPEEHAGVFSIVRAARDAAFEYVRQKLAAGDKVLGCDVDDACRAVIEQAGYGKYFIHRTGHSLHESTHGNGANIDNLESRDERRLIPRTCFTIEPGIYLPGRFGVRSEINIYLPDSRTAVLTGHPAQVEVLAVS